MTTVFLSFPQTYPLIFVKLLRYLYEKGVTPLTMYDLETGEGFQADMLSLIKQSDIVIAQVEFNEHSPQTDLANSYIEIGCAIGAGKPLIIVTNSVEQLPFDVASVPVIKYNHKYELLDKGTSLADSVMKHINHFMSPNIENQKSIDGFSQWFLNLQQDEAFLDRISPQQFEDFIRYRFIELGLHEMRYPQTGTVDGQIDFWIELPGDTSLAVVVKKITSQSQMGVGGVHKIAANCLMSGITNAIIITSGNFTESAFEFVRGLPMRLDLLTLEDFLNETKSSILMRFKQG